MKLISPRQTWRQVFLGSIAEFRNGLNYNKQNFGTGLKVINVKDFNDFTVPSFEELDQINPEGILREDSLLKEGDIVFVRSNGNRDLIGRSLFIANYPERVSHSAFTIRVRFTSDEVIPRFYAYLFRSTSVRKVLTAQGGGTNISNLNQTILQNLSVPLPPLPTQRKIASVLSAYDGLIENNTRRIEILEEMAQAIYREWFVNFRFPGHEKVRMVDSSLGRIPEGWEVKRLGEVLELAYGKALKKADRVSGKVPVYGSSGIVGYHRDSMVNAPGIVVGRKGSVGSVYWADDDFFPIDTVYYVQCNVSLYYVYYNLQDQNFINNDAAVPGLNRNQAYALPFLLPTAETVNEFENCVIPIFQELKVLWEKNDNLRRTRDLLLPKLISGEVDVEEPSSETIGGKA